MKIAFVVHDYSRVFGHSRYVAELATRFARDHEVHVFANRIAPDAPSSIRFHRVPAWRTNAFTTVLSFLITGTVAVRGSYDVIHGQGMCVWTNDVITVHQVSRAWYLSHRGGERRSSWRQQVFGMVVPFLERVFYRRSANAELIAISDHVRRDLQQHYQCTSPTSVIYHGVDRETFSPRQRDPHRASMRATLGVKPDDVLFLFVGDMRKGARQCIQALGELPEGKLVFVSWSKPGEWKQLVADLSLKDRVMFAGSSSEVERYYAAADVFLLPTSYDAFALVATEAMASGLPVVVSRAAGASELIAHGENGFILEDVEGHLELAGHMRRLQGDSDLRRRVGKAAHRSMAQRSWDRVAEETMTIYERRSRSA